MNQVTQTMSSGCGFFPSLMVAFLWKSLFSVMLCPWLPAVQKYTLLPTTPAEERITLKHWSSLWLCRRNPFSCLRQSPDGENPNPVPWFAPAANYGARQRAFGSLIGPPVSAPGLERGPPPGSCDRGEEVCSQKESGVLLPKARRNKCKASNLLFVAYRVLWFCYGRRCC